MYPLQVNVYVYYGTNFYVKTGRMMDIHADIGGPTSMVQSDLNLMWRSATMKAKL